MAVKRLRMCVVAFPFAKAFITPLSNLEEILCSLSDNIYIITGDVENVMTKVTRKGTPAYKIECKKTIHIFTKIMRYIFLHARVSLKLIELSKNVDIYLFFGEGLLLPQLTAKLLRKNVVLSLAGASGLKVDLVRKGLLSKLVTFLSETSCMLSDRIIVYSESIIKEWNLQKYRNKIYIAHEHFIDFDKFKIKKKIDERENLVGYIGRLSGEKGILNFIKAISEIIKERDDLKILIGGDGQLRDEIEKYVSKENLNDKVELVGWIPHDELPDYLNELKLVVLPSYTEGLPNIMLEAMACGTPVLATPVGAIPGVIKDGETGFLMEDNSPECIAKNVIRALNNSNLDIIVKHAREFVEKEYTYEAAVDRYRKILENLGVKNHE